MVRRTAGWKDGRRDRQKKNMLIFIKLFERNNLKCFKTIRKLIIFEANGYTTKLF